MKKEIILLFILVMFYLIMSIIQRFLFHKPNWEIKSIDTMKYSRDLSKKELNNPSYDNVIDKQVSDIANTGANYVAISTPYDKEFTPYLKRWVLKARKYKLHVWFRGNFSGWEQWFGYKGISPETHIALTDRFIRDNPGLFQDGDIYSPCHECEYGSKLNLNNPTEVEQYRQFLIKEYSVTKQAFKSINKKIPSNYFSMTGYAAFIIMDKKTTKALDGIVVIDHYVKTPDILVSDIKELADKSGGTIILGEIGVPIPEVHGKMSQFQQTLWMENAINKLSKLPYVKGVNYWTNGGSSTALWDNQGKPYPVLGVIKKFYY